MTVRTSPSPSRSAGIWRGFIAGDRFTIADITALVAIDMGARLADIKIAPEFAHLTHWYETVSSRPSAKA